VPIQDRSAPTGLRKSGTIRFCSVRPDLDEVLSRVAEHVYGSYDGGEPGWALIDSPQLWRISLGGRAGVVGVNVGGHAYCAKLYYDGRLQTRLRVLLGLAKARWAYSRGLRLERLGIRSPKILGYAERRPGQLPVLVMELLTGVLTLDQWIARHGVTRPLIASVARFIRHMHDQGVVHVDLSPRNLMVSPSAAGFDVWLLDCEDVRFRRRLSDRARLADLHHLDERVLCTVSLRSRLRFLQEYAGRRDSPWRKALDRMVRTSRSKYVKAYRSALQSRPRAY
jgi:tRNA A-37 threonylcarbamoyl transferase component Bud32